jgi:hypothetical protein
MNSNLVSTHPKLKYAAAGNELYKGIRSSHLLIIIII